MIENIAAFVAAAALLTITPGLDTTLVLRTATSEGARPAALAGAGVVAGVLVWGLLVALGLAVLILASALAFTVLKWAGAAYLVYLGIRALREKQASAHLPAVAPVSASKAFFQAIPAEVLNPKTALFFLAFLPQFVRPEHGSSFLQFTTLGLIFVGMSALYTTLIVLTIRPLGKLVKRLTWLGRWQNKIIGVLFISLGLRVATQTR